MIDLARHFHGPKQVKKIVESMASYKMNRLQLGISNDEGWRLQILSIPELTNIGSIRSHQQFNKFGERRALSPAWGDSHSDTGGFFTHGEFVDLLKFSKLRGVEIILEINLPGHSNAILRSLENPKNADFVRQFRPVECIPEIFFCLHLVGFSIGYVVVYSDFSVGAIKEE